MVSYQNNVNSHPNYCFIIPWAILISTPYELSTLEPIILVKSQPVLSFQTTHINLPIKKESISSLVMDRKTKKVVYMRMTGEQGIRNIVETASKTQRSYLVIQNNTWKLTFIFVSFIFYCLALGIMVDILK